jgi:nifR3 family TIM-barrel protein
VSERADEAPRAVHIGPLEVWPPVVLAPMAGVTDAPFRRLCRGYGAGLYVSEMITARALVERNARTLTMARFAPDESPRSIQLYGVAPATTAEAARVAVGELGAQHVDLNFGCPAAKVTRKGGGAALPFRHRLFAAIVAATVRAADPVPVTVKFRMGIDDTVLTHLGTGRVAATEGAAAVALHARTAEQLYSGSARWDAIGELKAAVAAVAPDVPVLGNGDLWEAGDALAMMAATGCDGVVVGRGCLGRPWLFGDLAAAFDGRPPPAPPTLGEVAAIMRRHAALLQDWFGGDIRRFRKHAAWYVKGFPVGSEARHRLTLVSSLADLDAELEAVLAAVGPDTPFPPEANRMVRGHSNGPRPVSLPSGWLEDPDDPTPPEGAELLVSGG